MKRGFTVVEIMVVVSVLVIIVTLTTAAYTAFREKSYVAQQQTLVSAVKAGAEKYYDRNNTYPAGDEASNNNSCSGPSDYSVAADYFSLDEDDIDNTGSDGSAHLHIVPKGGSNCGSLDKEHVYYYTKASGDNDSVSRNYNFDSCTYTLEAGEAGSTAYLLAFWNSEDDAWQVVKSNFGHATTSDPSTCPFVAT